MRFHRTTGLSPHQLDVLLSRVERRMPNWDKAVGRPKALPLWQAVVVLCFLLRHNNAQVLAAELFDVSQPTVSRYCTVLRPQVTCALRSLGFGIARLPREEPVLVDGFLAECWDWKAAERLFSAKHHCPGHNVQVIADLHGRLRRAGPPVSGARHDAYAYRACGAAARVRRHLHRFGDKGYQGCGLNTPYKKPRHRTLTEAERTANRDHARLRAAVERCIGHLQNWKILATAYRGPLDTFPEILQTVTQLELLRTYEPA